MSPFAPPTAGRHRATPAPTAARRVPRPARQLRSAAYRSRLGRAAVATVAAGAPLAGLGLAAPVAHAETDWDKLAQCESSGNWSTDTGNGFSGGLQFTPSTWKAFGGSGDAEDASREEQIAVAEKVKAAQGMNAWPTCSKKTGQTSSAPNSGGSGSSSSSSDDDEGTTTQVSETKPKAKPRTKPKQQDDDTQVAAARTEAPAGGDYTVRQGDTLSSIAASRGTTWKALQDANTGVISDPDMILPGWTLRTG